MCLFIYGGLELLQLYLVCKNFVGTCALTMIVSNIWGILLTFESHDLTCKLLYVRFFKKIIFCNITFSYNKYYKHKYSIIL